MKAWPVQDAKARFSEMLEACLTEGPQLVTKRGSDAAVLVPIEEWRRQRGARPHGAVLDWLQSVDPRLLRLLSVSLGEIQASIEITRDQDPGRAAELERWADEVARTKCWRRTFRYIGRGRG